MAPSGGAQPLATLLSSALEVEVSEVLELAGLGNVLLVVGGLLGIVRRADLGVLRSGETSRDVRVGTNGSRLQLLLNDSENSDRIHDPCNWARTCLFSRAPYLLVS